MKTINVSNTILYIVIPCYNEEKVLPITMPVFKKKLEVLIAKDKVSSESRILFVNDGSIDRTWSLIETYSSEENLVEGISLSRNRGHQNALLAGLMEAKKNADITISIDCDGQDDIEVMDEMIDKYYDGCEIVYGVRNKRDTDSFFKMNSAIVYYKLIEKLGGEIVYNHADYRLVSKRVLNEFENYKEVNLFLRGMFPMVGFKSTSVFYEREKRLAGETHYPLRKMIALALNGITSLSVRPIRIITGLGIFFALFSLAMIIWVLAVHFGDSTVPGWSSSVISVCLIGGIQLISLGVIGEYIGKIYLETKARPRYIISEKTYDDAKNISEK